MSHQLAAHELAAAALLMAGGATIVEWPAADLGGHALMFASSGWAVIPLRGKIPHTTHGVKDATTGLAQVAAWWKRWPTANIGGRVPDGVVVIDIDPRNGGDDTWGAITAEHGDLQTRTAITGRGDGGKHLYIRHPGGRLNASLNNVGPGIDIKTNVGYTVLPPSRHPLGGLYRWHAPLAPISVCPPWLVALLRAPTVGAVKGPTARAHGNFTGDSVADWFSASHTWGDVIGPHGWKLISGDGDGDGSTWGHPAATAASSATIRHGCLFVFSTSTLFDPTSAGAAHGYTKFRAFAMLDHGGDLPAAARAARQIRAVAA